MPSVTEQAVVCPVGKLGAYGIRCHGDVIDQEHDQREYRKSQPAVRHHFIDPVGNSHPGIAVLLQAGFNDRSDVYVTLICNDALGIIIQLLFCIPYIVLYMRHLLCGNIEFFQYFGISLKDLDGIPPLPLFGHVMQQSFFNVRKRVFHDTGEPVLRNRLAASRCPDGSFRSFLYAFSLKCGDLYELTAHLA